MTYNKTSLTKRQLTLRDTKHPRHQQPQPKPQVVGRKARISRRTHSPNAGPVVESESDVVETESEVVETEIEVSRYFVMMQTYYNERDQKSSAPNEDMSVKTTVAGPSHATPALPQPLSDEDVPTSKPQNTYVPARYANDSPSLIHHRRTEALNNLRTAVTDMESNGAPADTQWVSFSNPGQVLEQLYELEASLEAEDAADSLEAVQMVIRALHVALRLGRTRTT